MGRFASTVPFYAAYRPPYPAAFFAAVAEALGLDGDERLVDLGAGPGLLALGFAPFVDAVTAVEPEPAMAQAARAAAAEAGRDLAVIESTAERLPAGFGPCDLVTIGRALHWMEPGGLVAVLERLVAPGGAVLVCGSRAVEGPANGWLGAFQAVRERWSGPHPPRCRHDLDRVFAGSRFSVGERIAARGEHRVTVDDLVGRALSMSSTAPAALGADAWAMARELHGALAPFCRDGALTEIYEASATVVR